MKRLHWLFLVLMMGFCCGAYANKPTPTCGKNESPYRDFDFLVGNWDFFTMDGKKIGNQVYERKEEGCLIQETWETIWGDTGTGINFVDPATKKWRQVWMSPSYHIDYSGGLVVSGDFVLEGVIYPNDGKNSSPVRGVYSKKADGSVVKEFLKYDKKSNKWERFFIGVARKQLKALKSASTEKPQVEGHRCHSSHELSKELDFLRGRYEYYLGSGEKLGETEYELTSGGCAILERFISEKGDTSIGLINLDVVKGEWRHFWSSERFTFELFGKSISDSKLIFEGSIINNSTGLESPLKGTWIIDSTGNIRHNYEIYDSKLNRWNPFFSDISKKIS